MKKFLLLLIFLSPSALFALSDGVSEYIAQAQAAMNDGKFKEASEYYESALFSGHMNGHVLYNYGISLWRQNDIGAAMAAFLGAKRYIPRNPDLKTNLEFVHKSIQDKLDYAFHRPIWSKPFFWIDNMSRKEQAMCISVFMFLACFCFALFQYNFGQAFAKIVGGFSVVLSLVFVMGLSVDFMVKRPVGAVHVATAKAYSGPSTHGNTVVFEVSQGSPVQLLESDSQWAKVILSDGKKGWIEKSAIRMY